MDKRYSQATKLKQDIEERQRQKAAERQKNNETWNPRFFSSAVTPSGKPELTEEGHRTLKGISNGDYKLEENKTQGAQTIFMCLIGLTSHGFDIEPGASG